MIIGTLDFREIMANDALVPASVAKQVHSLDIAQDTFVAAIDASLADTAAFCEAYDIDLAISANCIIVEAKRADKVWYCACVILATDSVDVNGIVRKALGARKTSFASKDIAIELTGMEYGGITPIGLPGDTPLYVDEAVMRHGTVIIGSGYRLSKIAINTAVFEKIPNAQVLDIKRGK